MIDLYKKLIGKWVNDRIELADQQKAEITDLERQLREKKAKTKRTGLVQGGKTKLKGGDIGHDIVDGLAGPIGWIILGIRKSREKKLAKLKKELEGKGFWDVANTKRRLEDLAKTNPKLRKLMENMRKSYAVAKGGSSISKAEMDALMKDIEREKQRSGPHPGFHLPPRDWLGPLITRERRCGGDGTRAYPNTLSPFPLKGGDGKHPYPGTLAPKMKGGMLASEMLERYGGTLEEQFEKWKEEEREKRWRDHSFNLNDYHERLRDPDYDWKRFLRARERNRTYLRAMKGGASPKKMDFNSLVLTAGLSNLRDKLK